MNAQFKDIQKHIDTMVTKGELPNHLYESTDGIARMISAIQQTKGEKWTAQVLDKDGQPMLTPEEQQQFAEAFQPYIETIVSFLGDRKTGGQAPKAAPTVPGYEIPNASTLTGMNSLNIKTSSDSASSDPETMTGIDNIYAKVVQRMGMINSAVNNYASKYGVLHLEKKSDVEPDIRLIPQPLAQLISKGLILAEIPPQVSMDFMNKFKVPFRFIVFVIYLFLDVARVTASVTGSDSNRKILSIVVSLLDLLRGDWKKAILSFMGYYGTTPLLMGNMLKFYMSMFQTLSPTIQDSIIFGALDSTKSFIIGMLLAIFKITAPENVRLPLIGMLEKIANKKAEIDGVLVGAGLSARSDSYAPTFEDFNNIQTLMDDPEFICSTEFETLIEQVNNTSIINMILQILRIPVTKEFRAYRCGTKPSKPFLTLIVDKAKENKATQEVLEKPFSSDDLDMPVSVALVEAPVETPTDVVETPTETPAVEAEVPAETSVAPVAPAVVEVPAETPVAPAEVSAETPVAPAVAEVPTETPSETPVENPLPPVIPAVAPTETPAVAPVQLHAPGPAKGGSRKRGHPRRRTRKLHYRR